MATQAATIEASAGMAERKDRWVPLLVLFFGLIAAVMVSLRVYQGLYAWSYGMDATLPEFHKYWINLFYFDVTAPILLALGWGGYLLWTEPRETPQLTAQEELRRIRMLWVYLAGLCFSLYWAASFFAEQDAAWHQVAIRDTAFTPSHVVLFYFSFPFAIALSVISYLYARSRLPHIFRDRGFPLSFGLVMLGAVMLMFWVGFNEWGHSFWIAEEIFAAPLHWGFVLFAYLVAGIFPVWFQTVHRIIELQKSLTGAEEAETKVAA
jgi:methane/ammonia monooxygenase subunit C